MVSEFQCKHEEARLSRHTNLACYVNYPEVCVSLGHASCLLPMVDGIRGLTFFCLARYLYGIYMASKIAQMPLAFSSVL